MTEDLNGQQVAELQQDLAELAASLKNLLLATESGTQPVKLKDNAGRLSRMDEMHNQSILVANRNVTQNRLKQVLAAQGRIERGSYGFCADCDEAIAYNRLKAYPEAALCLECKSASE